MPGESVTFTRARAFQDYVRTYAENLYSQLFYGFKSAQLVTAHEGIKGEKILTELEIGDNLAKRWAKSFDPVTDAIDFIPRKLKTVLNKVDLSIVAQEFETSYLGMMRQKGQKVDDIPFQAYIFDRIMAKLNQELEYAFWQAAEAATPAATDFLRQTFDGILTIITKAITATTITPVVTGAINSTNAVEKFRLLWEEVDEANKEAGVDFACSYALYDAYRIRYKTLYGQHPNEPLITGTNFTGMPFELGGGNSRIIPFPGMSGSGRVVLTQLSNLHYGMDAFNDIEMFNVEQEVREMRFWMDFRMGTQIGMIRDGSLVVNDQA